MEDNSPNWSFSGMIVRSWILFCLTEKIIPWIGWISLKSHFPTLVPASKIFPYDVEVLVDPKLEKSERQLAQIPFVDWKSTYWIRCDCNWPKEMISWRVIKAHNCFYWVEPHRRRWSLETDGIDSGKIGRTLLVRAPCFAVRVEKC